MYCKSVCRSVEDFRIKQDAMVYGSGDGKISSQNSKKNVYKF